MGKDGVSGGLRMRMEAEDRAKTSCAPLRDNHISLGIRNPMNRDSKISICSHLYCGIQDSNFSPSHFRVHYFLPFLNGRDTLQNL